MGSYKFANVKRYWLCGIWFAIAGYLAWARTNKSRYIWLINSCSIGLKMDSIGLIWRLQIGIVVFLVSITTYDFSLICFSLTPYFLQILSWRPRAVFFPNFTSVEVCQQIIEMAKPKLEPSKLALRKGETAESTKDTRTRY